MTLFINQSSSDLNTSHQSPYSLREHYHNEPLDNDKQSSVLHCQHQQQRSINITASTTHRSHHHPCNERWWTDFPQLGFPIAGSILPSHNHPDNMPSDTQITYLQWSSSYLAYLQCMHNALQKWTGHISCTNENGITCALMKKDLTRELLCMQLYYRRSPATSCV